MDDTNVMKNIVFDDIAHMPSSKKRNPIVTELFITGSKLNISLVSLTQSFLLYQKALGKILHTILL